MRLASRNQYFNDDYEILTLEETIELLLNLNENFPKERKVGLYIETKMY